MSYQLLGPLRVVRHGRELDLGGPKQRAVLAALLLEVGRVVSTDRLVDLVWGEAPPGRAASGLQAYVSHLRRVLRDSVDATSPIVRRSPGYLLDVDPAQTDVGVFGAAVDQVRRLVEGRAWSAAVDTAEEALGLVRGPVLADLADEEWVQVATRPLQERRLACERDLVTALLGVGRPADAQVVAERLVTTHPLDERARWLQAVALHQAGRTADALAALRSLQATLDEELGLEPGPDVRDLQLALLRQDPVVDHWPALTPAPEGTLAGSVAGSVADAGATALPIEPTAPPTAPALDALVGREAELEVVDRLWAAAEDGAPWLVLTGPAGIGKSRLAREAADRWPGRVVTSVCPEDAGVPTWWPLRRLVRDLGGRPETVLQSPGSADADAGRFAVYEQVSALLADAGAGAAGQGPLLVHLEDVQWADPATLGLLTHLATTSTVPGSAFLLTARSEFATGDGTRLMAAVDRRAGSARVTVPPLTRPEVGRLVAQVAGPGLSEDELDDLARRTAGNPLFVAEYARLPADQRHGVPDAVRAVLQTRLATLPDPVLAVLHVAAIIGEALDVDLLTAVSGLDIEDLAERLDVAADEEVLVVARRRGGYAFAHALVREALLATLPESRLRALHLQVARALRFREDPGGLAARATHLLEAGSFADATEVREACRAVAVDAQDRWDPEESAHWWATALEVHDTRVRERSDVRDRLVTGLTEAWIRSGHGQRALDLVESSLDEAWRGGRRGSVGLYAAALSRLTGAWPWIAYGSHPGPLLDRLAGLEPLLEDDPATRARVLGALAIGSCYSLDPDVPDGLSARAIDLARGTGDPAVLADALLARAMTYAGVASRAEECLELLAELGTLDHPQRELDRAITHGVASMATMVLGDADATARHLTAGTALATQMRLPVCLAQLQWGVKAMRLWTAEDLDAVDDDLEASFAAHARTELSQSVTLILARLTWLWEHDRLAEGIGMDHPFLSPWIDAVVAAARGDADAADLVIRQVQRPEPQSWTSHGRLTLLAHAAADLGLVDLVPDLIDALAPAVHRLAAIGHCGIVGPVDAALARLEAMRGDRAAARDHLDAAHRLAVRSGGARAARRCEELAGVLV